MTPEKPKFWKSPPFLLSTLLVIISYAAFWLLSPPSQASQNTPGMVSSSSAQETENQPHSVETLPENAGKSDQKVEDHFSSTSDLTVPATPVALAPPAIVKTHQLKRGDSLALVLSRLGVSDQEIYEITTASKTVYNLKKIHPGQMIEITFDETEEQVTRFSYEIDPFNDLEVEHNEGQFKASKKTMPLEKGIERRAGTITDTLYESAHRLGVPPEVILDLSDIFAWDVDFALDIRKGDHFNLVYEVYKNAGNTVRTGRVLAAEMHNRGKTLQAFYFKPEGGRADYYDENGRSLRKAFLKSPLRYRYISSGYATRRLHPVLKVNRPHLGIDFAAKRGTPVRAAGDGVVSFAGWHGGYGKTVIIRHKNGYKTLYGHLSSFFKGIKKGKKVKQEDFIGRVGSTGLSTGPHLHYTLYKKGKAINPRKADVLRGAPLAEKWRTLFSDQVALMNQYLFPTPDLLANTDSL